MADEDDCCGVDENQIRMPGYRRALLLVVILNVVYGVIELFGGFLANSQALKADALDFLGDGSITFLGLLAIGWSLVWRARSALIQGVFLGLLGFWVIVSTILKAMNDTPVEAGLMGLFAVVALVINVVAVLPLLPYRDGDANMRGSRGADLNAVAGLDCGLPDCRTLFAFGLDYYSTCYSRSAHG